MGAEVGATTSIFPLTSSHLSYLSATNRSSFALAASQNLQLLSPDPNFNSYDSHHTIDLSLLEPHLNGPHTPDLATPLSKFGDKIEKEGWEDKVHAGLIGSCTNSSYEDMGRVVSLAKQARKKGLKVQVPFMVTPGSERIRETVERDGMRVRIFFLKDRKCDLTHRSKTASPRGCWSYSSSKRLWTLYRTMGSD
jgi:aconitase A